MVAHVGDVEISSAVVSHSLRRVEERRQRLAVLISLLRPAADVLRARIDGVVRP